VLERGRSFEKHGLHLYIVGHNIAKPGGKDAPISIVIPAKAGIHRAAFPMNKPGSPLLAIEHSPERLSDIASTLEAAGYSVRRVSPDDALTAARDSPPDAILIDVSSNNALSLIERMTQPMQPLAVMERRLIEAALRQTDNDVPRAAAMLQVNPSTIYRKLHAWRTESG
jgi:DNA-binding NtrC family response regulator